MRAVGDVITATEYFNCLIKFPGTCTELANVQHRKCTEKLSDEKGWVGDKSVLICVFSIR